MFRFYKIFGALLLAASLVAAPTASFAGVFVGIGISVDFAPPALPVYVQPPCVQPDTIWTPGYWAYGPYGYYWVPGTWVEAPQLGYLWTPGYWGYGGGAYAWHAGYWGPHVGYYGGVNYGFGYAGNGFFGGGWSGNHFRYNTAVTNVNRTTITNVYVNRSVVNTYNNATINRTSYNGGPGGLTLRPTASDLAYRSEPHLPLTEVQNQHVAIASQNRNFLAAVNHGRPQSAAVAAPLSSANRPAEFAPATAADRSRAQTGIGARTTVEQRSAGIRDAESSRAPSYARAQDSARSSSMDRAPSYAHTLSTSGSGAIDRAPSYAHTQNTGESAKVYRAPSTYRTQSAQGTYRTQSAQGTYRTQSAHASYRAPSAYNAARSSGRPSAGAGRSAQHAAAPRGGSGHPHDH